MIVAEGLAQVSDGVVIREAVDAVLAAEAEQSVNIGPAEAGVRLPGGKVMARMGKADARLVNDELRRRLDADSDG